MSAGSQPSHDYVLGNSENEHDRLQLQAAILKAWTEDFFRSAGLREGMDVLDVGCGMGDVALLAAEIVGPSGRITAIDRDAVVIGKAQERSADFGRLAPIEFIRSEILDFRSERSFDAVVGRYVLLYQPDPVKAVQHLAAQVRSGGVVVFHDMDFRHHVVCSPRGTLWSRMYALLSETFQRAGVECDCGMHLTRIFLDAGLPWPTVKGHVPVGGGPSSYLYHWVAETLRSLLPKIEAFGLSTAEVLPIDTLAARMQADAIAHQSQLVGPLQFGAWVRRP